MNSATTIFCCPFYGSVVKFSLERPISFQAVAYGASLLVNDFQKIGERSELQGEDDPKYGGSVRYAAGSPSAI
jgi:hypothetical protein